MEHGQSKGNSLQGRTLTVCTIQSGDGEDSYPMSAFHQHHSTIVTYAFLSDSFVWLILVNTLQTVYTVHDVQTVRLNGSVMG